MVKYDCTLYGIRTRAEDRRAREKAIQKYESIHNQANKNPVKNRFEIESENQNGIQFTFLQEVIAAIIFYAVIYLYWFTN